jgi:hypothetical protein
MAVVIETLMGQDLELGILDTTKTHPSGGTLNGTQISLSTFATVGAGGYGFAAYWTPGTVAAGGIVSTIVTIDGAHVGDKVLVALDNIGEIPVQLTGHVCSENHVMVVLSNLTGSSQTFAQGTLSVLVFHHRVETVEYVPET